MLALLAVFTDFGFSIYFCIHVHMPLYCNVLAFAYKSLCQVCLLRAKIVMVFRFDVDLRDSACMDAFHFEEWKKISIKSP